LILAGFASFHILISLWANPEFFSEYLTYGQTLEVNAAPISRFQNFIDFYLKLFYQISGTYYIPPMKVMYLLCLCISVIITITYIYIRVTHKLSNKAYHFTNNRIFDSILMIIAYNIAIFIIGRFNTTSILFAILPMYLLLFYIYKIVFTSLAKLKSNSYKLAIPYIYIAVLILLIFASYRSLQVEYSHTTDNNYEQYLTTIKSHIDEDSIILGNLSSGFAFNNNEFYDIRNLSYLENETLEDYITARNINTIIYYEEYDYIHRNQQWEILYGDDEPYYNDLNTFLTEKATIIHTFEDMYYGSRIIRYLGDYPWKIYIYLVD